MPKGKFHLVASRKLIFPIFHFDEVIHPPKFMMVCIDTKTIQHYIGDNGQYELVLTDIC